MVTCSIDRNFCRRPFLRLRQLAIPLGICVLATTMVTDSVAAAEPATLVPVKVVKVVTRAPVGQMLATVAGASLYTPPSTGCTGGCLSVWPPLYIARGDYPTGTKGLGVVVVTVGSVKKRQVTYNGKQLYTFASDSGHSLNGNGVGGFSAAVVS